MPRPKLTPADLDRILAGEDVWGDQVWLVPDWNTPEPVEHDKPISVTSSPNLGSSSPNLNVDRGETERLPSRP